MKNTYDIIVVGGGLTGVAAACAAARRGADVLLVEASGCLGGALAQNLVYPFMSNADRKSTRLNSSHSRLSRMPSSA